MNDVSSKPKGRYSRIHSLVQWKPRVNSHVSIPEQLGPDEWGPLAWLWPPYFNGYIRWNIDRPTNPRDVISDGMIDTLQGIASRKDFFWKAQPLAMLALYPARRASTTEVTAEQTINAGSRARVPTRPFPKPPYFTGYLSTIR